MKNHYIETRDDLYDPQLVRCVWDDELDGRRCFTSDSLDDLMALVRSGNTSDMLVLRASDDGWDNYPFCIEDEAAESKECYHRRYAYYDPYYEMKLAYLDGAQIQCINRRLQDDDWHDGDAPCWDVDMYDFRIKPEPKTAWRPFQSAREMLDMLDPEGSMRGIWLAMKQYPDREYLVTGVDYSDDTVLAHDNWYTMQDLFDRFWVNDGPVGIKEGEE